MVVVVVVKRDREMLKSVKEKSQFNGPMLVVMTGQHSMTDDLTAPNEK